MYADRFISNNKTYTKVNDARFKMSKKGTKNEKKLPPTQSSWRLHIKGVHYQCTIWLSSFIAQPDIGSPEIVGAKMMPQGILFLI